jgi:hypothetical protein
MNEAELREKLATSLAYEKTVTVAPPTGSWDHWPAGWMARRSYTTGLRHRRNERRDIRRRLRKMAGGAQ